ncbi:MAG: hypothetical protein ACOYM3_11945 [Terrimicrobiaceae bacterium]
MKTQNQTHHEVVTASIAEVEKLIDAEENAVGLDPVAAIAAMEKGAVFDCGPGATSGYGRYRCKFHIRITAEVAGRRVKIGNGNRITARVGTVLLAHIRSGLISRYKPDHDSFLAAGKALCEKLNALGEYIRCDGRYTQLPAGGFGLVVSRQGSTMVVRIKDRLHALIDGHLEPLKMAA